MPRTSASGTTKPKFSAGDGSHHQARVREQLLARRTLGGAGESDGCGDAKRGRQRHERRSIRSLVIAGHHEAPGCESLAHLRPGAQQRFQPLGRMQPAQIENHSVRAGVRRDRPEAGKSLHQGGGRPTAPPQSGPESPIAGSPRLLRRTSRADSGRAATGHPGTAIARRASERPAAAARRRATCRER